MGEQNQQDRRMRIKVRVTREDILNGDRRTCRHCALALAIERAVKQSGLEGFDGAYVFNRGRHVVGVQVLFLDWLYEIPLKGHARDFELASVHGERLKPFEFDLELEKKDANGREQQD